MKKRITFFSIFAIFSLFCSTAWSKTAIIDGSVPDKFLTVGVRAGMTTSNISDNSQQFLPQLSQYNVFWRSGFTMGATVNMAINNFVSIKTGLNLQTRCYDITSMSSWGKSMSMESYYRHSSFYYVNIPVMVSFTINLGESARLSAEFGPYFAHGFGGSKKPHLSTANTPTRSLNSEMTTLKPTISVIMAITYILSNDLIGEW